MLQTIWLALLSTFGSSAAEGRLQRHKAKEGVWREWNLARGRFGWRANVGDIRRFLETVFQISGWETNLSDDTEPTREQLDQLFDMIAGQLLAAGVVSFERE